MNGKGDKWRGGWTEEFKNNYNNIFRKESKMKAISEALTDIKKYLEIEETKDIKVEYGTETNYKRSKSVTLTFKDEGHEFMITFTKVDNENR